MLEEDLWTGALNLCRIPNIHYYVDTPYVASFHNTQHTRALMRDLDRGRALQFRYVSTAAKGL